MLSASDEAKAGDPAAVRFRLGKAQVGSVRMTKLSVVALTMPSAVAGTVLGAWF